MTDQKFVLKWHYHSETLIHNLPCLIENDILTDITISAGTQHVRAHKVVLAMCSVYFLQLFQDMKSSQHPVVILHNVSMEDLRAVLSFIYRGQCIVSQEQLPSLLSVAKLLKIQGLCDMKVPDKNKTEKTISNDTFDDNIEQNLTKSYFEDNHNDYSLSYSNSYSLVTPNIDEIPNEIHQNVKKWNKMNTVIDNSYKPEDLSPTSKKTNKETSETCKCFLCGKYLSNQYNLRVHMETHEEAYHACNSCPHVSRSRDALRKHVSYRHPEEYNTRKRKKME